MSLDFSKPVRTRDGLLAVGDVFKCKLFARLIYETENMEIVPDRLTYNPNLDGNTFVWRERAADD